MARTTFRFSRGADPSPGALALLAAWLLANRVEASEPQVSGDAKVEALPHPVLQPDRSSPSVPLTTIASGWQVDDAVNALCKMVVRHVPNPRSVPAVQGRHRNFHDSPSESRRNRVLCRLITPDIRSTSLGHNITSKKYTAEIRVNRWASSCPVVGIPEVFSGARVTGRDDARHGAPPGM